MPFNSTLGYWHFTWRGNRLYFGPGLLGTLGIVGPSFLHEHVLTLIKGTNTEGRERCWILCFPLHICAKWVCTVLLFIDKPTHWCASTDILWRLLQGMTRLIHLYILSCSNIVWSKASGFHCSSSQRRTTRSLYSLSNLLNNSSFSCL